MKRFTQFGILCFWLFAAGFALCCSFSHAQGRESQPAFVSPIGEMVGGEPGEDPHLRFPPETKVEPIWFPDGSGGGGSVGNAGIGGSEIPVVGDVAVPYGTDCMGLWWRMVVHTLPRVLSR